MGQRLSLKGSKSTHKIAQPESKKYPLPVENLMLQQIKKKYRARYETISSNSAKRDSNENENDSLAEATIAPCQSEDDCYKSYCLKELEKLDKVLLSHTNNNFDGLSHDGGSNRLNSCKYSGDNDDDNEIVSNDQQSFNITDFPILVIQRMLDYLNPLAILALRATCKKTKAWIDDNPYILKDFKMRIDPLICKYHNEPPHTSPWSSFAIPYSYLDSDFIQDTIDQYSDIIWNLEVYSPKSFCSAGHCSTNYPCCLFDIIGQCQQLQRLSICRIDTLSKLPVRNECFQCLRFLSIDRIQWMHLSDFPLFENLIMKCRFLEYLKVPEYEILGSIAFAFFDQNTSPEREHLISPVMRYLDHYRRPVDGCRDTRIIRQKLYIDMGEFEDFKLCSSELFYELSRKCVECNAVLMNVYFVPRDAVLRNEQNLVESFASMFGFIKIDFRAELWKNLEVMECWIEDFPDDLDLTVRQFEFLKTVSKIRTLRSLTIRMSVDDPTICSRALEACVGQNYSGIRKLILRRHQVFEDTFVKIPRGLGAAFSNLKFLHFQDLDAENEDFAELWPSLPNLGELFIYKCPHLTQEAFLGQAGEDIPMLKLKSFDCISLELYVLVIFLYDGMGGFNDNFLVKGLRNMRLKGFALRGATGVEFTDHGMLSLLNSPFHDTVEDFEAPSSCFQPCRSSNYWRFYIALPKKELRRNRIWLSCNVLMNSISSRKHPYDFQKKCLGI